MGTFIRTFKINIQKNENGYIKHDSFTKKSENRTINIFDMYKRIIVLSNNNRGQFKRAKNNCRDVTYIFFIRDQMFQ